MAKPRSPFVETEILLYWLEEDPESIEALYREMLPGERHVLITLLASLRRLLVRIEDQIKREEEQAEELAYIKRLEEQESTIRGGYNEIEL